MYSEEIEQFLKMIKQCQIDYRYHYEIVGKKDKETQDLLHQLELGKYIERQKAATKLAKVRKERRAAKNIVESIEPIMKFIAENKKVVNTLDQLLGQVRKVENIQQRRVYKAKVRNDLTI